MSAAQIHISALASFLSLLSMTTHSQSFVVVGPKLSKNAEGNQPGLYDQMWVLFSVNNDLSVDCMQAVSCGLSQLVTISTPYSVS